MTKNRIVYITAPVEVAEQIAGVLVEEDLARCVNIIEHVKSVYKWEGHLEHTTESLLIAKGPAEKTDALIEKVREIHPYEVPEVLCTEIVSGNEDYLDWLAGKEIEVDEIDLDDDVDDGEVEEDAEEEEEKEETEG